MAKSWFSWLTGKDKSNNAAERRTARPQAAIVPKAEDFDPLTGALRWDRFLAMMNEEQAQAPGVLLIIDLSDRSATVSSIRRGKEEEIVPWMAEAIRQAIRSEDLLAHVEGYRFAALLRGAPQDVGSDISERVLESIDNTLFMTAEGVAKLEVTIGGAVFAENSGRDILAEAIINLGQAQNLGSAAVLQ